MVCHVYLCLYVVTLAINEPVIRQAHYFKYLKLRDC